MRNLLSLKKLFLLFAALTLSYGEAIAQSQGLYSVYDLSDKDFIVFEVIEHPTKLDANNEPRLLILGTLKEKTNGPNAGRNVRLIEFDIATEMVTAERSFGLSEILEQGFNIIPRYNGAGVFINRYHIVGSHENHVGTRPSRDILLFTLDQNYNIATGTNVIEGVFGTEGDVDIISGNSPDRISEYGRSGALSTEGNLVVMTSPNAVSNVDTLIPCRASLANVSMSIALMEVNSSNTISQYVSFAADNGGTNTRNLFGRDMIRDPRNGNERFVVTGRRDIDPSSDKNAIFLSIEKDANGDFQYVNGAGIDYYHSATPNDGSIEEMTSIDLFQGTAVYSEGYVLAGTTDRNVLNACLSCNNIMLFLTDLNGNVQPNSVHYYGTQGNQQVSDIIAIPDSGFAVLGYTESVLYPGQTDLFLMRVDQNFNLLWTKTFGGAEPETVRRIGGGRLLKRTNGFIIVGETESYRQGAASDLFLILTNNYGEATLGLNSTCQNNVFFESIEGEDLNERTWSQRAERCYEKVELDLPVDADEVNTQQNCSPFIASCDVLDSTVFETVVTGIIPSGSIEFWDGKYFFPCGTIVTVEAGATLDLTNVDLVFEQCAGIVFEEGAFLRANNSVFRSCDPSFWWLGLHFRGNAHAEINECTFKNANKAIYLQGTNNSVADVNITNTLFSNNFVGIQAENIRVKQGITGNTFAIDDQMANVQWASYCDAVSCSIEAPLNDYFGIRTSNAIFDYNISQNDFVSVLNNAATGLNYLGMVLYNTSAEISANNFTDMFRSITVSGGETNTNIENNEIEVTLDYNDETSQIQIESALNVLISGNRIVSSIIPNNAVSAQSSAIYLEDANNARVVNNYIEGFVVGLNGLRLQESYVGENTFMNNYFIGVLLTDGLRVRVACNSINMDFGSQISAGYEYIQTVDGDKGMQFNSNCVTEGDYGALFFANPSLSAQLPSVKNNQFTNYQTAGINNVGMNGNIGTGTTAFTAGRNTFFSNNKPNGAVDIMSNVAMGAFGNFGTYTVSPLVTVSGINTYSSSASCAELGLTTENEILREDVCDRVDEAFSLILRVSEEENALAPNFDERLELVPDNYRVQFVRSAMTKLYKLGDEVLLSQLVDAAVSAPIMLENEKLWIYFYAAYLQQDWETAKSRLAEISPLTVEEEDLLYVANLNAKMHDEDLIGIELNYNTIYNLQTIFERENEASLQAIALLNSSEVDYRFKPQAKPLFMELEEESKLQLNENSIALWPNPANDEVAISIVLDVYEGGMLKIYSVQGQLIYDQAINSNLSVVNIDVSKFKSGLYVCVLENKLGQQAVTKLTKM